MPDAPTPLTAYQQTYHWRNKNCGPWAQEWIKTNLPGVSVEDGPHSASITEVSSVTGDCDLGQRKGKLLTIYDLEVDALWEGKDAEGNDVKGTLKVPEVSHEAIDGLSDYVFEFRLTSDSTSAASALLASIRKAFPTPLKEKFNALRPALIAAHGAGGPPDSSSNANSGASTPNPNAGSSSYSPAPPGQTKAAKAETPAPAAASSKKVNNTAVVEVKATLQASAADLWALLTEESKIPMWSRSAAKISLSAGAPFELFGGNVVGKVVSVDAPKKLVQSWQTRSPSWPSDHFGTLTTSLDQGSDSTDVTFTLDGVPAGQEADVERALNSFYIQGLKQMGLVISSTSRTFLRPSTAHRRAKRQPRSVKQASWASYLTPTVLGSAALLGLGAVFVGLVASTFRS